MEMIPDTECQGQGVENEGSRQRHAHDVALFRTSRVVPDATGSRVVGCMNKDTTIPASHVFRASRML